MHQKHPRRSNASSQDHPVQRAGTSRRGPIMGSIGIFRISFYHKSNESKWGSFKEDYLLNLQI